MIEILALAVVVLAGLYFIVLAAASLFFPALAGRFLLGFATSAFKHYAEMSLRVAVGIALIVQAPRMLFSSAFSLFGWLLLVTTAGLLLVPWQWHQRFAQRVVPMATRHITLVGLVSLVLGGLMLVAVARGGAN
ncbi:MAG: hypothetical protein A3E01_17820 [Gammaproteobacteria bacterium RIFCSPHIGHO2_12_FULL_63_22]|nr:MAG: hypothetical protein A3E01_17820 [Gammaproteobacteria bacterium RIFCSPHIGHO2_12_FULL_63_22]